MTIYGTLTIFMFIDYPTIEPDHVVNTGTSVKPYGRKTLYKAHSLTEEAAKAQTLSFLHHNRDRLNRQCVFAKWQADPVEIEID